jgi:hypothetical protein
LQKFFPIYTHTHAYWGKKKQFTSSGIMKDEKYFHSSETTSKHHVKMGINYGYFFYSLCYCYEWYRKVFMRMTFTRARKKKIKRPPFLVHFSLQSKTLWISIFFLLLLNSHPDNLPLTQFIYRQFEKYNKMAYCIVIIDNNWIVSN